MRTLLMCLTLCLTVFIATAQEEKAKKMTERMTEKLQLTPEQATKVAPINLDFATKRSELKKSDLKGPEKKAKMEALETDYFNQLSTVLTPEQLETFKKNYA